MKLGWLSDIHLNFLDEEARARFFEDLSACKVDGWLVSGDLGEAPSIVRYLIEFNSKLSAPTYFVLGNHDFYHGSLAEVTARVSALNSANNRLAWLTESAPLQLCDDLILVGDDGWSDGRLGNFADTPVELNDFFLIEELSGLTRKDLVARVNDLGAKSAARLQEKLDFAAAQSSNVLVVTHSPPFEGATWHEGEISSPDWLPWFSCEAAGKAILKTADANRDTNFVVLCGHTHSGGQYSPTANVTVHTAHAEYGRPAVQAVVEFESDGCLRLV